MPQPPLHSPHSVQLDTLQGSSSLLPSHSAVPHGSVSWSRAGPGRRQAPSLASACRLRYLCPPHALLHADHALQSERLQLRAAWLAAPGQPVVWLRTWLQPPAPFMEGIRISLPRNLCSSPPLPSQPSHGPQSARTHSSLSAQSSTLQGRASRVAMPSSFGPEQALPPYLASCTTRLIRECQPVPQDLLHCVHSPQLESLQSSSLLA
mmetsp:Transcript_10463/g.28466  ORF Transcript_10463/g.28466 Transcript_10463/m.28466 type:complete len:207 (+) Transcript_10463:797-1417(+)